MANKNNDELSLIVPSEYVRNYMQTTGWRFIDAQKATLLMYGGLTLKEQHTHLQALQESTSDQGLKERLARYLDTEALKFQAFKENPDRAYIYILKVNDDNESYSNIMPEEYFFDFETACECGHETGQPFKVEKYLVTVSGADSSYVSSVTWLEFNKAGEAVYFCGRLSDEDGEINEAFYDFFEVPNPFEKGDIVRFAGTEDYGIVSESQKDWKEYLDKYRSDEWRKKGITLDFSDAQIVVEFLGDDGTFGHDHINPIYLELYQPEADRSNRSPMDNLLIAASDLHRGEGSLEGLYILTEIYRNHIRENE